MLPLCYGVPPKEATAKKIASDHEFCWILQANNIQTGQYQTTRKLLVLLSWVVILVAKRDEERKQGSSQSLQTMQGSTQIKCLKGEQQTINSPEPIEGFSLSNHTIILLRSYLVINWISQFLLLTSGNLLLPTLQIGLDRLPNCSYCIPATNIWRRVLLPGILQYVAQKWGLVVRCGLSVFIARRLIDSLLA